MVMPMISWRQAYGRVSAFINFVVPGVQPLGLLLLLRRELAGSTLALTAPFAALQDGGPGAGFPWSFCCWPRPCPCWPACPGGSWRISPPSSSPGVVMAFHMRAYTVIGGCRDLRLQLLQETLTAEERSAVLLTEG